MFMVSCDENACIGCEECYPGCPAHILGFEDGHAFVQGDEMECLGCETCVTVCPAGCFTITEM
jgi:ferredoxin